MSKSKGDAIIAQFILSPFAATGCGRGRAAGEVGEAEERPHAAVEARWAWVRRRWSRSAEAYMC